MPVLRIRPAVLSDLPALTAIYNDAVTTTTATLDLEPWTVEARKEWFLAHNKGRYPLLAAELVAKLRESGPAGVEEPDAFSGPDVPAIAGYASLSPLFPMAAYAASVELSIYIDRTCQRRGIGRQLMDAILEMARRDERIHMVVSKITAGNEASVRLHKAYGFQKTGVLREIAWKDGRRLDVEIYQLDV